MSINRISLLKYRPNTGLIFFLTICLAPPVSALTFSKFKGLGDLPGGLVISYATGISADGSVIVGGSSSLNGGEAFRYTHLEGMVGIGTLPKNDNTLFFSTAFSASANGNVIVGSAESNRYISQAFRYSASEGMVGLGFLDLVDDVAMGSTSRDVSGDGRVTVGIVESSNTGTLHAFRHTTSGGTVRLGNLLNTESPLIEIYGRDGEGVYVNSKASAISTDGRVIVGSSTSAVTNGEIIVDESIMSDLGFHGNSLTTEAFQHTISEGMTGIGDLPGGIFLSEAFAVSADGNVIVGQSNSAEGLEAFRFSDSEGIIGLGDLPGGAFSSSSIDVSADGRVIIGMGNSAKGEEAFVWVADIDTMQSLYDVLTTSGFDLSGWSELKVTGLSDDGLTIVGSGMHGGNYEAFVAQISSIPIPSCALLMGIASFGLLRFQRKQHN